MKHIIKVLLPIILATSSTSCGVSGISALIQGTGTSGKNSERNERAVELVTLLGRISTQTSSSLQGWSILAMPSDGSGGRFAEIDMGEFILRDFNRQKYWTLALLSPDSITRGVLSIPNAQLPRTIAQYFQVRDTDLPTLTFEGSIVRFENLNGLNIGREIASDMDGDGIPDGVDTSEADSDLASILTLEDQDLALVIGADYDRDGIPNEIDTDIDGDGVINTLDSDDDGDGILDIFDVDADSNATSDAQDNNFELYRNDPYVFRTQMSFKTIDPTSGLSLCSEKSGVIKIEAEANRNFAPFITIAGSYDFLEGAMVVDSPGNIIPWDRFLKDDGLNDDGVANDGFYSRTVHLPCGRKPQPNLSMILHAESGAGRSYGDYPLVFSSVAVGEISINYDQMTRSAILIGNPFGNVSDFFWNLRVNDDSGVVFWTSSTKSGFERITGIPTNIDLTGKKITAESFSLPKTFGIPLYQISANAFRP